MRLFGSTKRNAAEERLVELTPIPKERNPESRIGQIFLGKYKLQRFLGAGSNADVYLATHIENERTQVVIKRIKEEAAKSPRFQQFFDAEVRSMAGFVHPYAVKLIGASQKDPNGACLVLEFVRGSTLENVLKLCGRLSLERTMRVLGHLGHALYAAQKIGIVHRDLKPANLMIIDPGTSRESLKVMDFGFAGFTAQPHIQLAELTGKGSIFACGTPAYVSPEMIRGDSTDARADIYSVGVITYELLTGRLPFEYHDQQKLLNAHVRETPPKFAKYGATGIPSAVEDVVMHALAKFPSERPQNMKEMIDRFSRALGTGADLWAASAPSASTVTASPIPVATNEPSQFGEMALADGIDEQYILSDTFEACLPEKLAAIKLRGFVEEVGGQVIESEPGLIRVRVDMPKNLQEPGQRSGVFAFISGVRKMPNRGKEPIEIQLKMQKLDPNRVSVLVAFRPIRPFLPTNPQLWQDRCDSFYSILRKFVMPGG